MKLSRSRESWLVRHLWFQGMEVQATDGPFPTCPLERNECKTSSFGIHRAALPAGPYLLSPTSCPYLLSPTCWPYLLALTYRHLSSDPYVLAAGLLHKRRVRKHVYCGFQSGHQFSNILRSKPALSNQRGTRPKPQEIKNHCD